MKKFKNLLVPLMLFLMGIGQLTAQSLSSIKGTVTDGKEPLVGAAVVEKGTTNGAVTDIDGKFQLTLKTAKGAVLVVTFVGYKSKEVPVTNAAIVDIQLESSDALDELVVVGYGTQRKAVVTGAIARCSRRKARGGLRGF